MKDPWKMSWRDRLACLRLWVWFRYSLRTRNWRPFWFTLQRPREWFRIGSGLDR